MGREIRRVPQDWVHPTQPCSHRPTCSEPCLHPLYDKSYREEREEWLAGLKSWLKGTHEPDEDYWEYEGNPPEREYYRPDWPEESRTHLQIYETVSEGTPVSPVFAMKDELVAWLITQGTTESAAKNFAGVESCPSMTMSENGLRMGIETLGD